MNMRLFTSYISYLALLPALLLSSCQEDEIAGYDYTRAGEDVIVTVPVSLPGMDVKSRADLPEWQTDHVESLWIRTYSSVTGLATSEWKKLEPDSRDTEVERSVTIESKSGPSYIVAVANVENPGVSKDAPETQRPLSELLDEADTWAGFLNIAVVAPSTYETVNAPHTPLPMAGAYTNIKVGGHDQSPRRLDDWQAENFHAYTIPASGDGTVSLTNGAIHLRRLVSQVTFNLIAGSDDITLTPGSYHIVNVPRYSWLYERSDKDNMTANFGDNCTEENVETYYVTTDPYYSSAFTDNQDGSYSFNFWQSENKHTAISDITTYRQRQEQFQNTVGEESADDEWKENTGLFTSLTGNVWTPNNMATYVVINCYVQHEGEINVDDDGNPGGDTPVNRSGYARYIVHLGYMGATDGDAASIARASRDFNCFRNTRYTYNVTVRGLNDIRVEAFHEGDTPGVEGIVTDTTNPTIQLDCHYCCFNIELSRDDLKEWDPVNKNGFGFIITTYDNLATGGREKTYQETDFENYASYDEIPEEIKEYVNWIELRPTTGANTLATYVPRTGANSDGRTFNLIDASKGISGNQYSTSGYYTVFVNEYTYEAANADETFVANGRNIWHRYVNADTRRFFIRVNRTTSADGASLYARSKYAVAQQSILTYYTTQLTTEPEDNAAGANQQRGAALGVERENESFGLNLRRSFTAAADRVNGRYNLWEFTRYRYNNYNNGWIRANDNQLRSGWAYFLTPDEPQEIPAGNTGNPAQTVSSAAGPVKLAKIANYLGDLGDAGKRQYDPQPNVTDRDVYIEAINACMNRNRDNNGDGTIDQSELRWYVPAISKYLRLILGSESLSPYALMEYGDITRLDYPLNDNCGRYKFFASEGSDLWVMEGISTSPVAAYGAYPWQVRCVRNLGTALASEIQILDKTVPAYQYYPGTQTNRGGRVEMTYYQIASKRTTPFSGNGVGAGQMRINTIDNYTYNSIWQNGFEISQGQTRYGTTDFWYDGTITRSGYNNATWQNVKSVIESSDNPCNALEGTGWRLPNLKELAIMKNLGYLEGCPFYVQSCSMSAFAEGGVKTTPDTDLNLMHYFITANNSSVTQGHGGQTGNNVTMYVRCVRDYNP